MDYSELYQPYIYCLKNKLAADTSGTFERFPEKTHVRLEKCTPLSSKFLPSLLHSLKLTEENNLRLLNNAPSQITDTSAKTTWAFFFFFSAACKRVHACYGLTKVGQLAKEKKKMQAPIVSLAIIVIMETGRLKPLEIFNFGVMGFVLVCSQSGNCCTCWLRPDGSREWRHCVRYCPVHNRKPSAMLV